MIEIALTKSLQGAGGKFTLDVQTTLEDASLVALFGSSGAGKTTILRMLAGLTTPDSGKIIVDDQVWFDSDKNINLPPQRRSIGFVFQDYALFPHLTVRENLAFALNTQTEDCSYWERVKMFTGKVNRFSFRRNKIESDWVDELLTITDLLLLQNRLPHQLSGGQKQRVALARALARKPKLLLLDEPLSAVDTKFRLQLQRHLSHLLSCLDVTTMMVSHDVGEVFSLSQRVLRLDQGRIVEAGTPKEIFFKQRVTGHLNLRGQVLAMKSEDGKHIISLLIADEIVDVIASPESIKNARVGDMVSLATNTFNSISLD